MKNVLTYVALFVLVMSPVLAAENQLPEPGILPDSPFYGFKRGFESVGTTFTFGEEAKARRSLQLAEKRLAEMDAVVDKGKPEFVDELAEDYEKEVERANNIATLAKNANTKEGLVELVSAATSIHLSVLDEVMQKVPEQARASIAAAKEKSVRGNLEAIESLSKENPQKAREIIQETRRTTTDASIAEEYRQLEGRVPGAAGGEVEEEQEETEQEIPTGQEDYQSGEQTSPETPDAGSVS